ncbi:inositol monophosphatase family protein [Thermoproteota archaeon]
MEEEKLEKIIVTTVAEAGEFLRERAFDYGDIEWKKKDDPVTYLDKSVEQMIRKDVSAEMNVNFLGEEYGLEDNNSAYTLLIDPIDGTKSFVRREFLCAISVGVEKDEELIGGIVHDFMKDIMYVGFGDNRYILYQGKKQPFHQPNQFKKKKISLDGPGIADLPFDKLPDISLKHRTGSIALNMAQLAAGIYEGYIVSPNDKGNAWDVAAGTYLLRQGGFNITDIDGNHFDYKTQANGIIALHEDIAPEVMQAFFPKK